VHSMVTATSCQMLKVRKQTKSMESQQLARFSSRKKMQDGEARWWRMQNGSTLLDDEYALQVRLIRTFTFTQPTGSELPN
jgi:hypothetical protein